MILHNSENSNRDKGPFCRPLFHFIYLFIGKQPMMAGQGLKWSLTTQRFNTNRDTHTHTYKTMQTENTVYGEVILKAGCFDK